MQWRKLFDLDSRYATFSDKLAARHFIAARFGDDALPPLLWTGDIDDLPLDRMPPPFVLKSNHASGQVAMIASGSLPDDAALRRDAARWLASNHGRQQIEPGYAPIRPRLLIERTIFNDAGNAPDEVRIFVFDGRARIINTVFVEEGRVRHGAFHTPDWRKVPWHFTRVVDRPFPRPQQLDAMIRMAEDLGRGLDHVRVDFFDGGSRFWVGEMTLYSWSGMARFQPDEADYRMGDFWRIRHPIVRALAAIAFRSPGTVA